MFIHSIKYKLTGLLIILLAGIGDSSVIQAEDLSYALPPSRPVGVSYESCPDCQKKESGYYADSNKEYDVEYPSDQYPQTVNPQTVYPKRQNCQSCNSCCQHEWELLPEGLIYKSYLAGPKEPRFASAWLYESDRGWIWDTSIGGRIGLIRKGTSKTVRPQGWQFDFEAAAFPRLDIDYSEDLESVDFRIGFPLTWSNGPFQIKFGYYHISAHVGDEYIERNPTFQRVNYVRDALALGLGYYVTDDIRLYIEAAYAFNADFAEPWEFQFGAEYSPQWNHDKHGAPFFAINGMLFEEHNFGGNVNIMTGWQWRGRRSDHLFRLGLQYFNGKSSQYSFYTRNEELIGFGTWLDY